MDGAARGAILSPLAGRTAPRRAPGRIPTAEREPRADAGPTRAPDSASATAGARGSVSTSSRPTASPRRSAGSVLHRDLGPEATATSLPRARPRVRDGEAPDPGGARPPAGRPLRRRARRRRREAGRPPAALRDRSTGRRAACRAGGPRSPRGSRSCGRSSTEPKRGATAPSTPRSSRRRRRNLARALAALRDDKGALRRSGAASSSRARASRSRSTPRGASRTSRRRRPHALAALHARLLATAPVEIFLAGDVALGTRRRPRVERHLLWPGRARAPGAAPARRRPSARRGARPRRVVERDAVAQGKLAMVFRAPIAADSPLVPAAQMLAGVLGGSAVSRLFKVVRETHGLCYYAHAPAGRARRGSCSCSRASSRRTSRRRAA